MLKPEIPVASIEVDGLRVHCEPALQVAALRYFEATGPFAAARRGLVGLPLPAPLQATRIDDPTGATRFILAWRSPTETLLLSRDAAAFLALAQRLATLREGVMVEQTGGIRPLQVEGRRARDLLLRLGSVASIPNPGEAHSLRLAELHVLVVCIRVEEYLLFVERVYIDHLLDWVSATVADF